MPSTSAHKPASQRQTSLSARLRWRAAAIAYFHKLAGHEPPTGSEAVRATVRGIRRTIGTAPDRKAPATADLILDMLAHCPPTLAGKRDRALLALGFAGAFRRSELVALTVADLVEAPDGYRVMIRRSKTDQEGEGQEVAIPHGYKIRPVEAVQARLAAAEISSGPVFRPVLKGGRLQEAALSAHSCSPDRQALCRAGRPGSGQLRRTQPPGGVPDQRGRERRQRAEDGRGQPAQVDRHAPDLRPAGRSVPGARGRGVPLMAMCLF